MDIRSPRLKTKIQLYFLDKLTSNIIQFESEGFRIIKNINENIKEEKSENTEIFFVGRVKTLKINFDHGFELQEDNEEFYELDIVYKDSNKKNR